MVADWYPSPSHSHSGPKPLMTGVHLAVSRLNAAKAGAYLELHREAVEL